MNSVKQKLYLEKAVITAHATRKWTKVLLCTSPPRWSFSIVTILTLDSSCHEVGNQET